MVNRRRFVTAAAGTVVAAGLPAIWAPSALAAGDRKLRASWWRKRLNATAELQGENWHLVEIADVLDDDSAPELEQFTVVFRGAFQDSITEGIYRVKVGRAKVTLFVQPGGNDASASYSVAAVSRLIE